VARGTISVVLVNDAWLSLFPPDCLAIIMRLMKTLIVEENEGVAVVTLNRPRVLNSINQELIAEFRSVLSESSVKASVGALLVTGSGRAFCAGADLAPEEESAELGFGELVARRMDAGFNPFIRELACFPKPTIAAVHGVAAGEGVGVALSCDIVLAGRSASFIQVFGPKLALVPDMGCSWFLPHYVGQARARALALTGDPLSAEDAERWGLIWKCLDDDKLAVESLALAKRLARGPTNAFGWIKRALDVAPRNTLLDQLDYERDCQRVLGDQPNFIEGVQAFLSKRAADFDQR